MSAHAARKGWVEWEPSCTFGVRLARPENSDFLPPILFQQLLWLFPSACSRRFARVTWTDGVPIPAVFQWRDPWNFPRCFVGKKVGPFFCIHSFCTFCFRTQCLEPTSFWREDHGDVCIFWYTYMRRWIRITRASASQFSWFWFFGWGSVVSYQPVSLKDK